MAANIFRRGCRGVLLAVLGRGGLWGIGGGWIGGLGGVAGGLLLMVSIVLLMGSNWGL